MSDALQSTPDSDSPQNGQVDIPEEGGVQEVSRRLVAVESRLESFQGPVPHPSILKGYEELVPGSAERILAQAERQTDHRIRIEHKVIDADISRSNLGLWCGFILSVLAIAGGALLVGLGHDWAGTTIATAAVASLAAVFVYGTNARRKELHSKAEAASPPDHSSTST